MSGETGPFSRFSLSLFQALRRVPYCVPRNYDGLPAVKASNDLDFIVGREKHAAERVLRLVAMECGASRITKIRRHYVCKYVVHGIHDDVTGKDHVLIDFINRLEWKGLPWLDVLDVIDQRVLAAEGIFVPRPAHRAIINLFHTLLYAGYVKPKQRMSIQEDAVQEPDVLSRELSRRFAARTAKSVVGHIMASDWEGLAGTVRRMRYELATRTLLNNPLRTVSVAEHYLREAVVRVRIRLGLF